MDLRGIICKLATSSENRNAGSGVKAAGIWACGNGSKSTTGKIREFLGYKDVISRKKGITLHVVF